MIEPHHGPAPDRRRRGQLFGYDGHLFEFARRRGRSRLKVEGEDKFQARGRGSGPANVAVSAGYRRYRDREAAGQPHNRA